jgi:hypothetical protein
LPQEGIGKAEIGKTESRNGTGGAYAETLKAEMQKAAAPLICEGVIDGEELRSGRLNNPPVGLTPLRFLLPRALRKAGQMSFASQHFMGQCRIWDLYFQHQGLRDCRAIGCIGANSFGPSMSYINHYNMP